MRLRELSFTRGTDEFAVQEHVNALIQFFFIYIVPIQIKKLFVTLNI